MLGILGPPLYTSPLLNLPSWLYGRHNLPSLTRGQVVLQSIFLHQGHNNLEDDKVLFDL